MTSIRSRTHLGPVVLFLFCLAISGWLLKPSSSPAAASLITPPQAAPTIPLAVGVGVKPTPPRAVVSGRASVIDGDTLEIQGKRIRLFGIDAPESSQQCVLGNDPAFPVGRRSALALDAFINDRPVRCEVVDIDRYQRQVAQCFVGGTDINATQVARGWAYAFRRYSEAYTGEEFSAAGMQQGLWACDSLVRPWDYRASKK